MRWVTRDPTRSPSWYRLSVQMIFRDRAGPEMEDPPRQPPGIPRSRWGEAGPPRFAGAGCGYLQYRMLPHMEAHDNRTDENDLSSPSANRSVLVGHRSSHFSRVRGPGAHPPAQPPRYSARRDRASCTTCGEKLPVHRRRQRSQPPQQGTKVEQSKAPVQVLHPSSQDASP